MTATLKIFMDVSLSCIVHFVYELKSLIFYVLWRNPQVFSFFADKEISC